MRPKASGTGAPGRRGQTFADPCVLACGTQRRHKPILVCLFLAAASGMLFTLGVALPVLATRVFHLGGGGYGLMMSAFGVGALPGALLASAGLEPPDGPAVGGLALVTAAAVDRDRARARGLDSVRRDRRGGHACLSGSSRRPTPSSN